MKKIYKYQIHDLAMREIELPKGAEILTIQMQDGMPCLWALVDQNQPAEKRPILIIGTGHAILIDIVRYISTFQMLDGRLVWHAFETV